ncbi:MAG: hypothetical protein AB1716_07685 [Planctomycetota bacterium]
MPAATIRRVAATALPLAVALAATFVGSADTLELADGTVLKECYVRDEGVRYTVWKTPAEVGGPPHVYPRSAVKSVKFDVKTDRGAEWDGHPDKPDLTVSFIEITPKLAGLHGVVQYDQLGRPWIAGGSKLLVDMGDAKFTNPEGAVRNLKLKYAPGEELTFTAHVKNVGFAPARPFRWTFFIAADGAKPDGVLEGGDYAEPLKPMHEATFTAKWKWDPERRFLVTFRIITDQPEIARINNEATDALWAHPFTFTVSHGRVAAWHENRSAYGTFSFEDFYRWHVDIMNLLFAHSVFPATPEGIQFRVRLDRIVYAERVQDNRVFDGSDDKRGEDPRVIDGIAYDQGAWFWNDSPEELKTGKWSQVDKQWRNQTEWSLPHELGHQLGLVDHYAIDYAGHAWHTWPDNGAKVTHFMRYPEQMMHWHGPQVFGEADAGYLNYTIDKPRGYFGDYYFAIPRECSLFVTDINGRPLADAEVAVFQRGTVVKPDAEPVAAPQRRGPSTVQYWPAVEDGNFDQPVSQKPVIAGRTDAGGRMGLPNRPVEEVRTLNGFHRQDNPFGNINVVGQRGLMLIRVTKSDPVTNDDRPAYFWLEGHDLVVAWFRGQKERAVITLQTPFASADSPPMPAAVEVTQVDKDHVKVAWRPPANAKERQYLEKVIGYCVYRRIGDDGLNDRPWFVVATLGPEAREFTVDLRQFPEDVYWFKPEGSPTPTNRFGVTTLGACSIESGLAEVLAK